MADPKITTVKWTGTDFPPNVQIDESTGVITGESDTVGESTLAVEVETNYGKATGTISLHVEQGEEEPDPDPEPDPEPEPEP